MIFSLGLCIMPPACTVGFLLLVENEVEVSSYLDSGQSLIPSVRLFSYLERSLHVATYNVSTDAIESR